MITQEFVYVYVCVTCMGCHSGQKRVLGPMALKLQKVVSHLMQVLQTQFGSSGRIASALSG